MIDWVEITGKLRKHYGTLARAGRAAGVKADLLGAYNRGEINEPRFSVGCRIINILHQIDPEYVDELREQL